jgi:hypothetical protein
MPSHFIQLSFTFWIAAIANGGGGGARSKGFCVKDVALIKVEVFVKNVMVKVAKCPAFDWVGGCARFVGGEGRTSRLHGCRRQSFMVLMVVIGLLW